MRSKDLRLSTVSLSLKLSICSFTVTSEAYKAKQKLLIWKLTMPFSRGTSWMTFQPTYQKAAGAFKKMDQIRYQSSETTSGKVSPLGIELKLQTMEQSMLAMELKTITSVFQIEIIHCKLQKFSK